MTRKSHRPLGDRVAEAAEAVLAAQHYVSPIDLLVRLGWLDPGAVKRWRQGQIDCLERAVQVNLPRISEAMKLFRSWARDTRSRAVLCDIAPRRSKRECSTRQHIESAELAICRMEETMLAYIFWHVPFSGISPREYEAASLAFQRGLAEAPPSGFASCATYQISEVPWLDGRRGYEDWYFIESSAALDALNEAAVAPRRRDVHAAIASKMDVGHGGLYRHVFGDVQPFGARAMWLTRPRGIDYEPVLRNIADGRAGFLSCWRRQMVLGPADEFALIGTSGLNVAIPPGWRGRTVERRILTPASVSK